MVIGYAYAGDGDREGLERQREALRAAGCERVLADAGSWHERPELERALLELDDRGDCLIVCRLDRVGRSLRDLIAMVAEVEERGVRLVSLEEGIDTAAPAPGVFGALARFDRVLARERTRAGVAAERARRGGRRAGAASRTRLAGLEFAPDLIEPIVGFRHWRLVGGTLRSMFTMTAWDASAMTARCAAGDHDPAQTPAPGCTCGVYAYYEPCPRTASAMTRELVSGAVVVWGRVEAHATGMRAEHARIVGLALPLSRGHKRRAVNDVADLLGVPAVPHRELKSLALVHGAPLPASLRPPRQRAPVNTWNWPAEPDT